ncbi:MFS transporter, PAT family, beta-lactamase induction signal transducer AmpG [Methylobacillus rhizosphaerae]|uniref:MFS transporter, PAT family, beta-lactamase induction signal transducer AmpG n=1 Tax=Methylobacillus rhizosphaerae TaxID=551994 RepID=A0A238XRH8_9PROT|nr:AmpG family muropeptide MFS transporter [Methylobacillus rhizosphaerae]SNR61557.1 MFS transporter, PAT family, beta-lactamase induction signal transducer AmpG [Methylobacillus rhizosphaerae]
MIKQGWGATFRAVASGRMLVALMMGFASGLPLLLTGSTMQAWLRESGVDLATIGAAAIIGLPYTLKFLWAPLFDRYTMPLLGRRRGWLALSQAALVLALLALSVSDPAASLWGVALAALLVTFFSASQDIVIDAYRRESLSDQELGLGSAMFVNGYRVGMLLAGGGGLILADLLTFSGMYQLMALLMGLCIMVTLAAPEPGKAAGSPRNLRQAVIEPFMEFFKRPEAIAILTFILLYKLGDTLASAINVPFYLDLGFSKSEIGAVAKLFGFWATLIGGTLGGIWILRIGLYRSLWIFGFLQMASTFGFVLLAQVGNNLPMLTGVIAVENFTGGLGTAAFVGFMGAMTDRRFTATQYALLSSLMGVPRVILSAPTGWMADEMGWTVFFLLCTVLAIPGLLMIRRFKDWEHA